MLSGMRGALKVRKLHLHEIWEQLSLQCLGEIPKFNFPTWVILSLSLFLLITMFPFWIKLLWFIDQEKLRKLWNHFIHELWEQGFEVWRVFERDCKMQFSCLIDPWPASLSCVSCDKNFLISNKCRGRINRYQTWETLIWYIVQTHLAFKSTTRGKILFQNRMVFEMDVILRP